MAQILLIESATKTCSIGISVDGKLIAVQEDTPESYKHSEILHQRIDELLQEAGRKLSDLDAVCISSGPGSYTGLRIGVSAAKGFCYGAELKLLSLTTLRSLSNHAMQLFPSYDFYIPMIDARRMEVYTQVFGANGPENDAEALVLDENSYSEYLAKGTCLFFGDGSDKAKQIIDDAANFESITPSVHGLANDAEQKFFSQEFEDTAYFEPFYLKSFMAG